MRMLRDRVISSSFVASRTRAAVRAVAAAVALAAAALVVVALAAFASGCRNGTPSSTSAQATTGGGAGTGTAATATGASVEPRMEPGALAPLLEGVGNAHFAVTTSVPRAQRFFDQGLRLSYAFNHAEAERAFKEAQRLDPKLAMAWWGEALVIGPNINAPTPSPEQEKQAWSAVQQAKQRLAGVTPKEKALIEAVAARYMDTDTAKIDRSRLDRAYADAMAGVAKTYPDDLHVQALYAEALMDLTPWDYWRKDGTPTEHTPAIKRTLEGVIARDANHAGAIHFLIHTMEASKTPDQVVPAADKLGALAPTAGHMVHMPAHVYIRAGLYEKAAEANVRAIAADESYIAQCRAQGAYPLYLYPHNIHFLWAATTFEGRSAEAIDAARKMASKLTAEHTCGPASGQDWAVVPYYAMVRFGKWNEILAEQPISEKPYAQAIRHWARGLALTNLGRHKESVAEVKALERTRSDPEIQKDVIGFDPANRVLEIASLTLRADQFRKRGDLRTAIKLLQQAVDVQDRLRYNEPPEWHQPIRHVLGAALLEAKRAVEAEQVYKADLTENPENGWALYGLMQSLRAQNKESDAAAVEARFRKAWARADVTLTASRF